MALGLPDPQTFGPRTIAPSEYWADSVHRLLAPGLSHPQNTGRTLSTGYWPPDYRTLRILGGLSTDYWPPYYHTIRILGGLCPQTAGPRTMAPSEYWADSVHRLLAPGLWHPQNTGRTLSSDYWPPDYHTL